MKHHQRTLSRRKFIKHGAAVSLGAFAARSASPARAQTATTTAPRHGSPLRGTELVTKDRLAEGRFGLMFKRLPAFTPDPTLLTRLGLTMSEQQAINNDNGSELLTAGFTFLGQFIDHDITLDNTPLEQAEADPDATKNYRTPRYDLDSVYGKGPVAEPQYYDPSDRDKLWIDVHDGVEDVPRSGGKAIIPEPRNDENILVIQIHLLFMKLHNKLVEYVRSQGAPAFTVFESARRLTRWYYQWIVIHEFMPAIVGPEMANKVYQERVGQAPVITLNYYKPTNREDRPFMPVEFAAAAYRFGHSMVRPAYAPQGVFIPIFVSSENTATKPHLGGSRPIPPNLVIEWPRLFKIDPALFGVVPDPNVPLPFRPRKIDTNLSDPLFIMPDTVVPDGGQNVLATRNLLRGRQLGLPSGQQIARQMKVPVVAPDKLPEGWKDSTPLWYYILKEAELNEGKHLGPVGGRIVAEVLVGLLQRDRNSYLYNDPAWKPRRPIAEQDGRFTMADLITYIYNKRSTI